MVIPARKACGIVEKMRKVGIDLGWAGREFGSMAVLEMAESDAEALSEFLDLAAKEESVAQVPA